MRRALTILNTLLVMGALGLAGAAWWLVGRSGPKVSGTVDAPVNQEVRVRRDSLGIPHIEAGSIADAVFAQGFVTAQDRLWQMDMIRRVAAGELSEVAGSVAIESDTLARKLRMRKIAETQLRGMSEEERGLLAAYARGVNHYIETNRGKWGPEFIVMDYEPRPWSEIDTLLAALEMNRTLSKSWENDVRRYEMTGAGDPAKVRRLFPVRTGGELRPGSNAWAISGARTASGKPILASDPHLEYSLPSVWYLVHLKAPGLNVIGASLPGLPMVMIGHNERIAWGITSLQFDVQDLYVEKIDLRTGRYSYNGGFRDARRESELIAVKGEKPAEIVNWVTGHGPIFTAKGSEHMSLRWVAAESGSSGFPMLALNQAANWEAFRAALARLPGPGLNFVYADRDGNIGHQVAGRLPKRVGFSGELPVDGTSETYEWGGVIPFEQLPSYFNPSAGRVVSANENPFPENAPYTVSGFFASPHRQRQIHDRLSRGGQWKPEGMLSVQTDVYSAYAHFLARSAVAAVEKKGFHQGPAAEAASILKPWNGQMHHSLAAPVLANLLHRELRRRMAEAAAPKSGATYRWESSESVVEGLLRERPAGWFDDWDQLLVESLVSAHEAAERQLGRNASKWNYGELNRLAVSHPVFGRFGALRPFFSAGPVPMSGSSTTVLQKGTRLGPSMRFVADLSDWDKSLISLVTGQSGHVTSGHFKDQWEEYIGGKAFPLQFDRVEATQTLVLKPSVY